MTTLQMARHARSFYPLATKQQAIRQAVRWAAAVNVLGSRWLLAKQSSRLIEPRPV